VTVELLDRLLCGRARVHLDEAEATRLTGAAVGDDRGRFTRAAFVEQLLEILARGFEREVADVQLLTHSDSTLSAVAQRGARHPRRLPGAACRWTLTP
jgi:hypothetical protein